MELAFFRVKAQLCFDDNNYAWDTPDYIYLNPYTITCITTDYCRKTVTITLINGVKYMLDMKDFFQMVDIVDIPLAEETKDA